MKIDARDSPFQPGQPVSPENFKGRVNIIKDILKYFPSITNGKPQHFYISSKRGNGKTSLANFISDYARKNHKMITLHIVIDGVSTVDEMIVHIIERFFNEYKDVNWSKKLLSRFENPIKSVGSNIKFTPTENDIKNIKDIFPFYLMDLLHHFRDKKAVLIVIDDINRLSETTEFANWYKSFADTLATSFNDKAPIGIMLLAYPDKFMKLYESNLSLTRIFHFYELPAMRYFDVLEFYENNFRKRNIRYDDKALKLMVKYSYGMPMMMQEIGDATFWVDEDKHITLDDSINGVLLAGDKIKRYLHPKFEEKFNPNDYDSIFSKIGEKLLIQNDIFFTKREFFNTFNEYEIELFNQFIVMAKRLGFVKLAKGRKDGIYIFTNDLYPLYFYIHAKRPELINQLPMAVQ